MALIGRAECDGSSCGNDAATNAMEQQNCGAVLIPASPSCLISDVRFTPEADMLTAGIDVR
jgi:hypothetical protein